MDRNEKMKYKEYEGNDMNRHHIKRRDSWPIAYS